MPFRLIERAAWIVLGAGSFVAGSMLLETFDEKRGSERAEAGEAPSGAAGADCIVRSEREVCEMPNVRRECAHALPAL